MTKIHPSAIVDPKAELASGVEIGAYAVVGPYLKIGRDTKIGSHAVLEGHTRIGERCTVHAHACIGTPPQVRKALAKSYLNIGDDNIIREFVTINPGMHEGSATQIGNKNFFMMNVHVAHDCVLGNEITIANVVALAGHVTVEDHATIGGLCGIHQYVRIGRYAMIGGLSKLVSDAPPFSTCDGHPASFYGINAIGLRRAGFSPDQRLAIRRVLKMLLTSGKKISTSLEEVRTEFPGEPNVAYLLDFFKNSKRGLVRARTHFEEKEEPAEAV